MSHFETLLEEIRVQNQRAADAYTKGTAPAMVIIAMRVLPTPNGVRLQLLRENLTGREELPMVQHAQATTTETAARLLLQWVREFGWE